MQGTGDLGYISGNGQVTLVAISDRGAPVQVNGTTLDGEALSLADLRGSVVVVNVWGDWCAECHAEMPDLLAAVERTAGQAEFVGIDIRDPSVENARAFVRTYQVPYPSFYDPDGALLLAFSGSALTPRTVPATVVLDRRGRVAASIIGRIPSTTTLTDLVEDVAGESSDG